MDYRTRHFTITAERAAEWQLMRDAMDGESAVKLQGELYLAKPSGFKADPATESAKYKAYQGRAQFPEILAPSVSAMLGIVHGREIQIEIPPALEYLWEDANGEGLPLEAFHRRITRELLVIGRYAVLADAPEGGGEPFLAGYCADSVINWDADWWVLDETGMVRDGYKWTKQPRYRVLAMDGIAYGQALYVGESAAPVEIQVTAIGGKNLDRIPFAIANARDLSARIETPPLIGVARAALAIYQLSADYRHQLYMSGQETLVAINGDAPTMVGAGVVHKMSGSEGQTPDLKYVSPSCSGIDAHLKAMEDNRISAIQAGARLLEQSKGVEESGEARKLRFASETATLTSIAQASCALLERSLRNIAMIKGIPDDGIVVVPPSDLLDRTMTPQDLAALHGVYEAGGMSWQTYYDAGERGGVFSAERDADQEYALIEDKRDQLVETDPMGQE
jgi:Domain of unknown function (DUF4055)